MRQLCAYGIIGCKGKFEKFYAMNVMVLYDSYTMTVLKWYSYGYFECIAKSGVLSIASLVKYTIVTKFCFTKYIIPF